MTQFHSGAIGITAQAKADLGDYQYHFVKSEGPASGSVNMVNVGSAGSAPYPMGVLQNDPKVDGAADVAMLGPTLLRVNAAGSTIVQGTFLVCGSDGHGEPLQYAATLAGSSQNANAVSLGYTTGDGVLIEVWANMHICATSGS